MPIAKIVSMSTNARAAVAELWPAPEIAPEDPEFWIKARSWAQALYDAYQRLLQETDDDLLRILITDASAAAKSRVVYADNWIHEFGVSL